jgi:GrpB-like predicted nucleotidyltransferase (UPF0157 family)
VANESHADRQRQDPIKIIPYDKSWPASFDHHRSRVESALRPWIVGPVEHIGSTSVPGLAAKPIIDMLARVSNFDHTAGIVEAMSGIGWTHAPEPDDQQARKWSFCFPDIVWRTHHLHVHEAGSQRWQSLLTFRDHMRSHPDDAAEYARIKTRLANADTHDRPRYRAGKAPFIEQLLIRLTTPDNETPDRLPVVGPEPPAGR